MTKGVKIPSSPAERQKLFHATIETAKQAYGQKILPFFEHLVHIEDKASETGMSLFKLWPMQVQALRDIMTNRLVIIGKARQLGLTWMVLAYAAWRMIFRPGFTVIAISKTDDDAIELVDFRLRVFIFQNLPEWLIVEKKKAPEGWKGLTWEATAHELTVNHPNGLPSRFKAEASSPNSAKSMTANLVILDEWAYQQWAREIWASAYPTINRPGASVLDGQVIGLSTGESGTLFEEIWRGAPENGFKKVFLPWRADPRRTVEWYEAQKKALPNDYRRMYPATEEDMFSGGDEKAFPQFDPTPGGAYVCKPFKIPDWWKRWRANDPGVGEPFAWYWLAQAPDGRIFVYREFTRRHQDGERLSWSQQAKRVVEMSVLGSEIGEPELELGKSRREKFSFTATGWDAWRTDPEQGKGPVDYYRENGITDCIKAPADRIGRYAAVTEGFITRDWPDNEVSRIVGRHTARAMIFATCRVLIENLQKLVTDPNEPNRVKESPYDHGYDALGYGLQTWGPGPASEPKPEETRIRKRKKALVKQRRRGDKVPA